MMNRILSWKLPDGKYAYIFPDTYYKDGEDAKGEYVSDRISPNSNVWEGIIVKLNETFTTEEAYRAEFDKMNEEVKTKYGFNIEWSPNFYNFTQDASGVNIVLLAGKDGNGTDDEWDELGDEDFGEEGILNAIDYNEIIKNLLRNEEAKKVFIEEARNSMVKARDEIIEYVEENAKESLSGALSDLADTKNELLAVKDELTSQLEGAKDALDMASDLFAMGEGHITPEKIQNVFSNMDEYTDWMGENSDILTKVAYDYDLVSKEMGGIGESEDATKGLFSRFGVSLNAINQTVGTVEQTLSAAEGRIEDIATWAEEVNSAMTEVGRVIDAQNQLISDKISHIEGDMSEMEASVTEVFNELSGATQKSFEDIVQNYNILKDDLDEIWTSMSGEPFAISVVERAMTSSSITDSIKSLNNDALTEIERQMNAISGSIVDSVDMITSAGLTTMKEEMNALEQRIETSMTVLEESSKTITDIREEWSKVSGKVSTVGELMADVDPDTGEVMYFISGSTEEESDDIRVKPLSDDENNGKLWTLYSYDGEEENPPTYTNDQVFVHYNNKLTSYIQQQSSSIAMGVEGRISGQVSTIGHEMEALSGTMKTWLQIQEDKLAGDVAVLKDDWNKLSGKVSTVAELTAETDEHGEIKYFISGATEDSTDDIRVKFYCLDDGGHKLFVLYTYDGEEENPAIYTEDQVFVHYTDKMTSYIQQQAGRINAEIIADVEGELTKMQEDMNALEQKWTKEMEIFSEDKDTLKQMSEEWSKVSGKVSTVTDLTAETDADGNIVYWTDYFGREMQVTNVDGEWRTDSNAKVDASSVYVKYNKKFETFVQQTSSSITEKLTSNLDGRITEIGNTMDSVSGTLSQYISKYDAESGELNDLREEWNTVSGKLSTVAKMTAETDENGEVIWFVSGGGAEIRVKETALKGDDGKPLWVPYSAGEDLTNIPTYTDDQVYVHYTDKLESYIQQQASAITIGVMEGDELKAAIKTYVNDDDEGIISMVAEKVKIDAELIANSLKSNKANIGGLYIGQGKIYSEGTSAGVNALSIDGNTGEIFANKAHISGAITATTLTVGSQDIKDYVKDFVPDTLDLIEWVNNKFEWSGLTESEMQEYVAEQLKNTTVRVSSAMTDQGNTYFRYSYGPEDSAVTWDVFDSDEYMVFNRGVGSGGTNSATSTFFLSKDGLMVAKNAVVYGTVYASDGSFAGSISANSGYFAGKLSAASGTFKGELSAASGTFAGKLSAASGTFAGELKAATGTFKGELSAAKGTFAGELKAASGSFKGAISAKTGHIGGFDITDNTLISSGGTAILCGNASYSQESDMMKIGFDNSDRILLYGYKSSGSCLVNTITNTMVPETWSSNTQYNCIYTYEDAVYDGTGVDVYIRERKNNKNTISKLETKGVGSIGLSSGDTTLGLSLPPFFGPSAITGVVRVPGVLGNNNIVNLESWAGKNVIGKKPTLFKRLVKANMIILKRTAGESQEINEFYCRPENGNEDLNTRQCNQSGLTTYATIFSSNGNIKCNNIEAEGGMYNGTINSDGYFYGSLDCIGGQIENTTIISPYFNGEIILDENSGLNAVTSDKRYVTISPYEVESKSNKYYTNASYYRYIKNSNGNDDGKTYYPGTIGGEKISLVTLTLSSGDTITIPPIEIKLWRYAPANKTAKSGYITLRVETNTLSSSTGKTLTKLTASSFKGSGSDNETVTSSEYKFICQKDGNMSITLDYDIHLPTYSWLGMDKAAASITINSIDDELISRKPAGKLPNGVIVEPDSFILRYGDYGLRVDEGGIYTLSTGGIWEQRDLV